jgi:hypothetical protein
MIFYFTPWFLIQTIADNGHTKTVHFNAQFSYVYHRLKLTQLQV